MIDLVEPVLSEFDDLTAHQRLALADAFERGRQAPGIDLRPTLPLPPRSARQRRWRRIGLELTAQLGSQLAALDPQLASYKASLMASDFEAAIVSLSSWTELGMKLYLRPRSDNGEPTAALLAESRRGDLRAAMECATVLADTTIGMLERHDPHAVPSTPRIEVKDLLLVNGYICDSPLQSLRAQSLRAKDCCAACVPPAGIHRALNQWCHEMQPEFWTGVHPLVRAAIGYRELLRINPFISANGRGARLALQLLLHRMGWPVLPWEAAFEVLTNEDQGTLRTVCCKNSFTAFMHAMLRRAELAIRLGTDMLEALVPLRGDLADGFSPEARADGSAPRFAENLLRGPLVLGLFDCTRERRREELRALVATGKIDRVWSPFGAVYSVPAVRKFLRGLSA